MMEIHWLVISALALGVIVSRIWAEPLPDVERMIKKSQAHAPGSETVRREPAPIHGESRRKAA